MNEQVTEPLIETVNTLSSLILPIMVIQSIVQASHHEPRTQKKNFNINDAVDANLIDQEITGPSIPAVEEETDDGEMDRSPEYIDVSEQGTISNASRLDRVLKDRERSKYKTSKKSNIDLIDALTHEDIAYLFDLNVSDTERESLFLKFEVPSSARNRMAGALTTLNILLENSQVIGNITTGETFKKPMLDVLDDIVIDIDDIDSSIYNRRGIKVKYNQPSGIKNSSSSAATTTSSFATAGLRLPESIRKLIKSLVHLTLIPTLESWAKINYQGYPLSTLNEPKATEIYNDVIDWLSTLTQLPKYDTQPLHISDNDGDDQSSGSSYEVVSKNPQNDMKSTKIYNVRPLQRNQYRSHHSDTSSDSEDDNDSDSDDDALISVYPRRSKRVESAAERLGETRRKGENFDLDDILSVSYASEYYLGFSNRALVLLSSLSRYGNNCTIFFFLYSILTYYVYLASVRHYLIQDLKFIPVLIYLLQNNSTLTNSVLACLGSLFAKDPFVPIPEPSFQIVAVLLWRGIWASGQKQPYLFYSRLVLTYCSRYVSSELKSHVVINNPSFAEIDLISCSKYCIINQENCLQVRNDTWTFETVRSTRCVPTVEIEDSEDEEENACHKYAFEVKLESDGLMQVGWVNDHFEFDPEGGNGVGDESHSYGYDGCRVKKWHGKHSSMRTSYGLKWVEGDIITCTIDMDQGEISYYKNGEDMGIAFSGVSVVSAWYPAISLSTGQQCKFYFGGDIDPLR